MKTKIVFMGTPDFAVPSLNKLIQNFDVKLVVTNPDKPKGRSSKLISSPVKQCALTNNIEVIQPNNAKDKEFIDYIKSINPDLIVVAAYGQILTEELLNIPKFGSINVHASLLPKLRGAAPIQWSIINGDEYSGVTIMRMVKKLDAGNILSISKVKIEPNETAESLFDKLSVVGADLLIDTINDLVNGKINEIIQNDDESTYAPMLSKDMGNINWQLSTKEIDRLVRGLYPWPGCYTYFNNKKYKIGGVSIFNDDCLELGNNPGDYISTSNKLLVRTLDGIIKINYIQPEGKKMMPVIEFLKGNSI